MILLQKAIHKWTRQPPPFPSPEKPQSASQHQRRDEDLTSPQSPNNRRRALSESDGAKFFDGLLDLDENELLHCPQREPSGHSGPNTQEDVIVVGSDLNVDSPPVAFSPQSVENQAMDLGFDGVLRLIASRTYFSLGEPHSKKQEPPQMGAQFVRNDPTRPFVALSPSLNVLHCTELARKSAAEFAMAHKTSHIAPREYGKAKLKQFCFTDERISLQATSHVTNNITAWMCKV